MTAIKSRFGSHQSQSDFQRNAIVYTVLGAGATGAVLAVNFITLNFILSRKWSLLKYSLSLIVIL